VSAVRSLAHAPRLRVDYVDDASDASLAALLAQPDTLAVFGFGDAAPRHHDPRYLRVPLQPHGAAPLEVWRTLGAVHVGTQGAVRWAEDDTLHFGWIEVEEDGIGLEAASAEAYAAMSAVVRARGSPTCCAAGTTSTRSPMAKATTSAIAASAWAAPRAWAR